MVRVLNNNFLTHRSIFLHESRITEFEFDNFLPIGRGRRWKAGLSSKVLAACLATSVGNLFVKPNEQRQSREDLSDAMVRKGRMESNLFVKPNELAQSREDLSDAMARKGRMKSNFLPRRGNFLPRRGIFLPRHPVGGNAFNAFTEHPSFLGALIQVYRTPIFIKAQCGCVPTPPPSLAQGRKEGGVKRGRMCLAWKPRLWPTAPACGGRAAWRRTRGQRHTVPWWRPQGNCRRALHRRFR